MTSSPPKANGKATQKVADPIAYYDSNRGRFYTLSRAGDWIAFTEGSLKRRLRWEMFANIESDEKRGMMIQQHMLALQIDHDVSYAGPIGGYPSGIHNLCGNRVLVTTGPKVIVPRKGEFRTLKIFIEQLLGDKSPMLYAWLKSAMETLGKGPPFRPGQMLAIAGPSGCGKSLLQNILTELFGGRFAKPYDYLIGEDKWNDDLLGAEHLMIEDDASSTDYRSRRSFGSKLKNLVANQTQMLKRRFTDSLPVAAFSRVTITLNEEPECLMVLPPIDDSLSDKIILLRASRAAFPFGDGDLDARRRYREKLSSELPAFLSFLQSFEIPEEMTNQRYGVCGYQEPYLMQELTELTPEEELLTMIDHLNIWDVDRRDWIGTASQLQAQLLDKDKTGRVKTILSFSTACGVFLERLKRVHADRISDYRSHGKTREWTIKAKKSVVSPI